MKVSWIQIQNRIGEGMRISRKAKVAYLGRRMNKSKIKRLLATVRLGPTDNDARDSPEIFPFEFCPKCGCRGSEGTGNLAPYPEAYYRYNCVRCGYLVGLVDNSRFVHVLECSPEFKLD